MFYRCSNCLAYLRPWLRLLLLLSVSVFDPCFNLGKTLFGPLNLTLSFADSHTDQQPLLLCSLDARSHRPTP